jgi:pyridoxamine 5'-phosphate oxidase
MTLRDDLRSLKVFTTDPQAFDTDAAPPEPLALFESWLQQAITAGVSAPHAMVLATVAASGAPSARTLLLKDFTPEGFWFATLSDSPKGRDLAANPVCALTLYWREQGRQVRIEGTATLGPREVSERDFLSRHPKARVAAIAGKQSEPMVEVDAAMLVAETTIASDESYVPDEWNAYVVAPTMVEFWQSGPDREQVRLRYEKRDDSWSSVLIWP